MEVLIIIVALGFGAMFLVVLVASQSLNLGVEEKRASAPSQPPVQENSKPPEDVNV